MSKSYDCNKLGTRQHIRTYHPKMHNPIHTHTHNQKQDKNEQDREKKALTPQTIATKNVVLIVSPWARFYFYTFAVLVPFYCIPLTNAKSAFSSILQSTQLFQPLTLISMYNIVYARDLSPYSSPFYPFTTHINVVTNSEAVLNVFNLDKFVCFYSTITQCVFVLIAHFHFYNSMSFLW